MACVHQGSCLCGEVKFEVSGNFENFFLCHCEHCRKDTGSAHGSNLLSTSAQLKWILGEGNVTTYCLPSTRHTKSFCKTCGSALPNIQMAGKLLVVPAGSIDTLIENRPDAHIFVASRAHWDRELAAVPMIDGLPGE